MPHVHHIGSKIYVHRMDYPPGKFPLTELGSTTEIDWPYRTGRCVVMRVPLTRHAVCIGLWGDPVDEEEALTGALAARWIGDESGWSAEDEVYDDVR